MARIVVPREFQSTFAAEPSRCVHSGTDFSPVELDQHGAYIARWGNKLGGGALLCRCTSERSPLLPHVKSSASATADATPTRTGSSISLSMMSARGSCRWPCVTVRYRDEVIGMSMECSGRQHGGVNNAID